jgi:hypothetical protein
MDDIHGEHKTNVNGIGGEYLLEGSDWTISRC